MKENLKKRIVSLTWRTTACLAPMCVVPLVLSAKTATWTGAQSAVWDLTTVNWNAAGAAATFAVGDDAILSDSADVTQNDITFGAAVNPATVAVDVTDTFIWRYANNPFAQTKSIVKTGGGTLGIYWDSSDSKFTGLLDIRAGRVETSMPNKISGFGACTVFVRSGAELRTLDRISIGSPMYGSSVHLRLAGKYSLYNSSGSNNHGANSVKTLSLEGGSIEVNCPGSGGNQGFNGVFRVHDAIYATNGSPQTLQLVNKTSYGNCNLILGPDKPLEFCIADLSNDDGVDLTVQGSISRLNPLLKEGTVGFTKTGLGTMLWNVGLDANHYPNGTISVKEGTLRFAPIQNILHSHTNQTVYVSTNATLHFMFRNVMLPQSCFNVGEQCKTSFHVDHGTLIFGAPEEVLDNNPLWGHNFAGRELILDHATFVNHLSGAGTSTNSYGLLTFGELVSLKGDTPYMIGTTHANSVRRFNLFNEMPTEFRIDDIADGVDATFDGGFCDYYDIRDDTCSVSGFVKTGPGTMRLTGQNGTFTGSADIREGEVILDHDDYSNTWFGSKTKTYLGNMSLDRTITVWTNATLNLAQRNLFMMMNGNPLADDFRATIALRGGTLRQANNSCNAIPNLFVENGAFEHENGMGSWGCISVAGTLTVRGNSPFALDEIAGGSNQLFVLGRTNVVFDVADVTGSPADDLHVGLALCRPGNEVENIALGYDWGFTKTGAGTMRLSGNATTCRMNGSAALTEGTLLVDASDTLTGLSRLTVAAGAAIGGTGAVTNMTLAAGSGFAGAVGQVAPLTILGDMTLPSTGFVDISVPEGTPLRSIRVVAVSATGALSGDVSRWQVRINGQVPERNVYHVQISGRKVTAGFLTGTTLIFR